MNSRRAFLGQVASSLGSFAAVPRNVLGANDRIRLGIIGYGDRGSQIAREAIGCPDTDFAAVCDIYTERLEKAKADMPGVKTYIDHRQMLEDSSMMRVLIATPQHLHCYTFCGFHPGRQARLSGKNHGLQCGPCQAHARGVSASERQTDRPGRTSELFVRAGGGCPVFLKDGKLGRITAIDADDVPQHAAWETAMVTARLSQT